MYIIGVLSMIILPFVFFDWHARNVFMACAYRRRYGHGKSWNRAYRHYKTNWTFFQRILWIPLFKEKYDDKYRNIAYLSYIHFGLMIFSSVFSVIYLQFFENSKNWIYVFICYFVFEVFRFIYDNALAREKI